MGKDNEGAEALDAERAKAHEHAGFWMFGVAAAYLLGSHLSLPFIGGDLLAEFMRSGDTGGDTAPLAALVGGSLGSLVAVHLALVVSGRHDHHKARRIAAAIYLGITAIQAFALVLWLESLNEVSPVGDIVGEPGWRFRIFATLALTGGGALLWWLADRVDAKGRAHGALFLLVVATLAQALEAAADLGAGLAQPGAGISSFGAAPLAMLVAAAVTTVRKRKFPVRLLGSFEIRSSWDAAGLVLLAPLLTRTFALTSTDETFTNILSWVEVLLLATLTALFAIAWWRGGPDDDAPRPFAATTVTAIGATGFVLLVFAGFQTAGGVDALFAPAPLEGEARFALVLEPEDGLFASDDAVNMVDRLEALGAQAEASEVGPHSITLRVSSARSVEAVLAYLQPHVMRLHIVRNPAPDAPGRPESVTPRVGAAGAATWEGRCDVIETWVASLPADSCWAVQHLGDEFGGSALANEYCVTACLEPAEIGGEHVADANVATDPMTQRPIVLAELTSEGGERMARLTRENLRRQLAIVVDGEILSMPVIQSEISAGRLQITLGGYGDYEQMLTETSALVMALRPEHRFETRWVLAEERAF